MAVLFRAMRRLVPWVKYPGPLSESAIAPIINPKSSIEEERLEYYRAEDYYPVKIGDVFNSKYQVIGKLGYGSTATVWDLFEGEELFDSIFDDDGEYNGYRYLALIVGLLGPPPADLIKASSIASKCFDTEGHWTASHRCKIPSTSLEDRETRLLDSYRDSSLRFIRSMLTWKPEERKTAKELLGDPWLNNDD
ncbi:MAG: hypothetical protein MMC23_002979 [Stictis urceolatum]|nr:hypothetical protein [Stictis urceolata]